MDFDAVWGNRLLRVLIENKRDFPGVVAEVESE